MKTLSYLAATAALFLTVTPFAQAGTPSKAKKNVVVRTTTVDYTTVRTNQPQTSEYGAEIGSGAPHEERNPSQHPELFQYNR